MRVLYITNLPAPYKIRFFELLSKKIDLTVAYEREQADNRNEKWIEKVRTRSFLEVFLGGLKAGADTSFSFKAVELVKNGNFDTVVMNGISSPTAIITIAYMKLHKIKYGIMCDGMLPRECKGPKYKLKYFLISNADYYLSSNKLTTDVLVNFGAKADRIYSYPFSSVSEREIVREDYNKDEYKKKIGCEGKKVILYVGQFIYRKGIDVLVKAFEKINVGSNHLILIGGDEQISADIKENTTILGFKKPEELEKYYRAADVFVLPTREDIWGLVVNEAMARGVPVVTTECCGAGTAMIDDGQNGYIVPVDNHSLLAEKISLALDKSETMREAALKTAERYTVEGMAKEMFAMLQQVIN